MVKYKSLKLLNNKSLLNGALFAGFSFINQGFGFLLLLVLASYITPTEYGYLSLFSTIVMLLGYFMAMSTQGYLSIAYFKGDVHQVKETYSVVFIALLVSSVLLILFTIAGSFMSKVLSLPLSVLYIGVCISFLTIFSNLYLDYLRMQMKVVPYGIFCCGNAILNFIISILFVKNLLLGWVGRVWAQVFCFLLFGGYALIFFGWKRGLVKPSLQHVKKMLLWGIPLIPHLSTNFIRQGCDRYIINSSHTIEDVGYFSFALTLSTIISMIGFGFNQSNSVDVYKILGDKNLINQQKYEKLQHQRHMYIELYCIISIVVFVCCYFIMPIIMPQYADSMKYFPILAVYGFLSCIYLVYTNYLFFYNKTRNIMYITFGSAVLHLCLSLILTRYSLFLTAILYVATQMIVVLLIRYFAKKTLNSDCI